jgi:hypothetical protein
LIEPLRIATRNETRGEAERYTSVMWGACWETAIDVVMKVRRDVAAIE